jgi:hypothetical protein
MATQIPIASLAVVPEQIRGQVVTVETKGTSLLARAQGTEILDQPTYEAACSLLLTVKSYREEVAALIGPVVETAHNAHKAAVAVRTRLDGDGARAEALLKDRIGSFLQEQDRRQREEQAWLQAARQQEHEQERLTEATEVVAAGGSQEDALQVLSKPDTTPAAAALPVVEAVQGISKRMKWYGECFDIKKLVQAAAKDDKLLSLLECNGVALNKLADALRERMEVPGCRSLSKPVVAARL